MHHSLDHSMHHRLDLSRSLLHNTLLVLLVVVQLVQLMLVVLLVLLVGPPMACHQRPTGLLHRSSTLTLN